MRPSRVLLDEMMRSRRLTESDMKMTRSKNELESKASELLATRAQTETKTGSSCRSANKRRREEAFGVGAVGHAYIHGILLSALDASNHEELAPALDRVLAMVHQFPSDPVDFTREPSLLHDLLRIVLNLSPLILPAPPPTPRAEGDEGSEGSEGSDGDNPGDGADGDGDRGDVAVMGGRVRNRNQNAVIPAHNRRGLARAIGIGIGGVRGQVKLDGLKWRLLSLFRWFLRSGANLNARNEGGDPVISVLIRIVCHSPKSALEDLAYDMLYHLVQHADRGLHLCQPASTSTLAYSILYNTPPTPPVWLHSSLEALGMWTGSDHALALALNMRFNAANPKVGILLKAASDVLTQFSQKTAHTIEAAYPPFPPEICESIVEYLCGSCVLPEPTTSNPATLSAPAATTLTLAATGGALESTNDDSASTVSLFSDEQLEERAAEPALDPAPVAAAPPVSPPVPHS